MSKSRRIQRQAIDIAYNIVLAQIAVASLHSRHCVLIRHKIGEILSKASEETIMEAQAARQFDALDRDKQLLILSSVLAGSPTIASPGLEWTFFDNPLVLKIDSLDVHRARLLYFQWQSLSDPDSSALDYLYEYWLIDVLPDRQRISGPSTRMATGHA